jgi:hypothetical protein
MLAFSAALSCSLLLPHGLRPALITPGIARSTSPVALVDGQTFEPVFNPAQAGALLGVIALPFGYWWFITVPEARIGLAKDKRLDGGEARAYLEDLAASAEPRAAERWFFSKWLRRARPSKRRSSQQLESRTMEQATPQSVGAGAQTVPVSIQAEAQVPPAPPPAPPPAAAPKPAPALRDLFRPASLKGNATPRFWSGDNPIVVTMGTLLGIGIVAAGARENAALTLDAVVLAAGLAFGLSRLTLD